MKTRSGRVVSPYFSPSPSPPSPPSSISSSVLSQSTASPASRPAALPTTAAVSPKIDRSSAQKRARSTDVDEFDKEMHGFESCKGAKDDDENEECKAETVEVKARSTSAKIRKMKSRASPSQGRNIECHSPSNTSRTRTLRSHDVDDRSQKRRKWKYSIPVAAAGSSFNASDGASRRSGFARSTAQAQLDAPIELNDAEKDMLEITRQVTLPHIDDYFQHIKRPEWHDDVIHPDTHQSWKATADMGYHAQPFHDSVDAAGGAYAATGKAIRPMPMPADLHAQFETSAMRDESARQASTSAGDADSAMEEDVPELVYDDVGEDVDDVDKDVEEGKKDAAVLYKRHHSLVKQDYSGDGETRDLQSKSLDAGIHQTDDSYDPLHPALDYPTRPTAFNHSLEPRATAASHNEQCPAILLHAPSVGHSSPQPQPPLPARPWELLPAATRLCAESENGFTSSHGPLPTLPEDASYGSNEQFEADSLPFPTPAGYQSYYADHDAWLRQTPLGMHNSQSRHSIPGYCFPDAPSRRPLGLPQTEDASLPPTDSCTSISLHRPSLTATTALDDLEHDGSSFSRELVPFGARQPLLDSRGCLKDALEWTPHGPLDSGKQQGRQRGRERLDLAPSYLQHHQTSSSLNNHSVVPRWFDDPRRSAVSLANQHMEPYEPSDSVRGRSSRPDSHHSEAAKPGQRDTDRQVVKLAQHGRLLRSSSLGSRRGTKQQWLKEKSITRVENWNRAYPPVELLPGPGGFDENSHGSSNSADFGAVASETAAGKKVTWGEDTVHSIEGRSQSVLPPEGRRSKRLLNKPKFSLGALSKMASPLAPSTPVVSPMADRVPPPSPMPPSTPTAEAELDDTKPAIALDKDEASSGTPTRALVKVKKEDMSKDSYNAEKSAFFQNLSKKRPLRRSNSLPTAYQEVVEASAWRKEDALPSFAHATQVGKTDSHDGTRSQAMPMSIETAAKHDLQKSQLQPSAARYAQDDANMLEPQSSTSNLARNQSPTVDIQPERVYETPQHKSRSLRQQALNPPKGSTTVSVPRVVDQSPLARFETLRRTKSVCFVPRADQQNEHETASHCGSQEPKSTWDDVEMPTSGQFPHLQPAPTIVINRERTSTVRPRLVSPPPPDITPELLYSSSPPSSDAAPRDDVYARDFAVAGPLMQIPGVKQLFKPPSTSPIGEDPSERHKFNADDPSQAMEVKENSQTARSPTREDFCAAQSRHQDQLNLRVKGPDEHSASRPSLSIDPEHDDADRSDNNVSKKVDCSAMPAEIPAVKSEVRAADKDDNDDGSADMDCDSDQEVVELLDSSVPSTSQHISECDKGKKAAIANPTRSVPSASDTGNAFNVSDDAQMTLSRPNTMSLDYIVEHTNHIPSLPHDDKQVEDTQHSGLRRSKRDCHQDPSPAGVRLSPDVGRRLVDHDSAVDYENVPFKSTLSENTTRSRLDHTSGQKERPVPTLHESEANAKPGASLVNTWKAESRYAVASGTSDKVADEPFPAELPHEADIADISEVHAKPPSSRSQEGLRNLLIFHSSPAAIPAGTLPKTTARHSAASRPDQRAAPAVDNNAIVVPSKTLAPMNKTIRQQDSGNDNMANPTITSHTGGAARPVHGLQCPTCQSDASGHRTWPTGNLHGTCDVLPNAETANQASQAQSTVKSRFFAPSPMPVLVRSMELVRPKVAQASSSGRPWEVISIGSDSEEPPQPRTVDAERKAEIDELKRSLALAQLDVAKWRHRAHMAEAGLDNLAIPDLPEQEIVKPPSNRPALQLPSANTVQKAAVGRAPRNKAKLSHVASRTEQVEAAARRSKLRRRPHAKSSTSAIMNDLPAFDPEQQGSPRKFDRNAEFKAMVEHFSAETTKQDAYVDRRPRRGGTGLLAVPEAHLRSMPRRPNAYSQARASPQLPAQEQAGPNRATLRKAGRALTPVQAPQFQGQNRKTGLRQHGKYEDAASGSETAKPTNKHTADIVYKRKRLPSGAHALPVQQSVTQDLPLPRLEPPHEARFEERHGQIRKNDHNNQEQEGEEDYDDEYDEYWDDLPDEELNRVVYGQPARVARQPERPNVAVRQSAHASQLYDDHDADEADEYEEKGPNIEASKRSGRVKPNRPAASRQARRPKPERPKHHSLVDDHYTEEDEYSGEDGDVDASQRPTGRKRRGPAQPKKAPNKTPRATAKARPSPATEVEDDTSDADFDPNAKPTKKATKQAGKMQRKSTKRGRAKDDDPDHEMEEDSDGESQAPSRKRQKIAKGKKAAPKKTAAKEKEVKVVKSSPKKAAKPAKGRAAALKGQRKK